MRISKNFKNKLEKAKEAGYKRVACVIGGYMGTTYCEFHNIDSILNLRDGTSFRSGYMTPRQWAGTPNTRHMKPGEDILYQDVFRKF